jgi:hypothetical protein
MFAAFAVGVGFLTIEDLERETWAACARGTGLGLSFDETMAVTFLKRIPSVPYWV